ncbi:MAG: hypothetical protein J7604_25950 [Sporocytophaga sp.]|uniref:hypothetical protein n=1 Tax=Sporocytophaga sp. TaxID=2231183 RepID=UPI001B2BCE30|nr:hypothetical protein [Sporocytophaga sp.]MBO9703675.1 hypothetical protein [Sporocytophaga sp.]
MKNFPEIEKLYNQIRQFPCQDLSSSSFSVALTKLTIACQEYLKTSTRITLISKVVGKEYFSFCEDKKNSRAVRMDLFTDDIDVLLLFLTSLENNNFESIKSLDIDKACYTIAISFCAIIDLEKIGDQKTPGTFFEHFIGHCFSKRLNVTPKTRVDVLNLDKATALPTDYIFDLGKGKAKFHVPIKTSTRERVIQVWAHQRVLDGVYGNGRFYGTLACLSETKVDKKSLEVIEICLPQQWQLYQMFIAQMKRVYYLDIPTAYLKLNDVFPKIHVKTFSDFIEETKDFSNFD